MATLVCDGDDKIAIVDMIQAINEKADISGQDFTGPIDATAVGIGGKLISPFGFKNRITNGAFMVSQITQSITAEVNDVSYVADVNKFGFFDAADGKITGIMNVMGNKKSARLTATTAITGQTAAYWNQGMAFAIESQNIIDSLGEDISISFVFKSNKTGIYPVSVVHETGVGNASSYFDTFTYDVAGVEQTVEVTVPLPAAGGWGTEFLNDNSLGLTIHVAPSVGTTYQSAAQTWDIADNYYIAGADCVDWADTLDNYIEVANMQLEKGSNATEFEILPASIHTANVQRYFIDTSGSVNLTNRNTLMLYPNPSLTSKRLAIYGGEFPVTMRAIPSASVGVYSAGIGFIAEYQNSTNTESVSGVNETTEFKLGMWVTMDNEPIDTWYVCNYRADARL